VTHEGPHYRVRDVIVLPRPTQRPHPPLMIGGRGPRMLRIAAREAQIVALVPALDPFGLSTLRSIGTASVEKRIAMLRRTPRFSEIELNVIVFDAAVTDAGRSILDALAARLKSAVTAVVDSPFVLYGSRSSIVEDLLARRDRLGISYIAVPGKAMRAFGPIIAALRGK
jgi:alkanesulfonate monooxygenase SsuD/methylene tetrahydromethanopterin reductase-like flavin-dependent oxidoreductase (luciferase family)